MGRSTTRQVAQIIAIVAIVLSTPAPNAAAETLYKYVGGSGERLTGDDGRIKGGDGFSPYQDALLALTISDGVVTGELRPLLGDDGASVQVQGTNPRDGVLELTINYRPGPKKLSFAKEIIGQKVVWRDTDTQHSTGWFYRYLDSPLSDAAMTLSEYECGSHYRTLMVDFKPGVTGDRLTAFLAGNAPAATLPVTYAAYDKKTQLWTKKTTVGLGELLKLKLKPTDPDAGSQFDTAVGTEAYVVKWLRGSGLFASVDIDSGGCDGADRAYFAVDRGLLFDADGLSQPKFEQYIATRLPGFVSQDDKGKAWQFRLGQPRVTKVNVPPFPSAYRIRVYAASEITRHVAGWWDAFSVTFEPGELKDTKSAEYAIVVTVERLKASKRSSGNSSPPDDAYFTKDLSPGDEAEVTAALAQYFSRRDRGWCLVALVGDDAEKHHAVCDGRSDR